MAQPFLSDADVQSFRELSESAMPDSCTVHERDETRSGRERATVYRLREQPGSDLPGEAVKCRVASANKQANPNEQIAGRLVSSPRFELVLPLGTIVEETDVVSVTVKLTGETSHLVVDTIAQPDSYGVDITCVCSEPQNEPTFEA